MRVKAFIMSPFAMGCPLKSECTQGTPRLNNVLIIINKNYSSLFWIRETVCTQHLRCLGATPPHRPRPRPPRPRPRLFNVRALTASSPYIKFKPIYWNTFVKNVTKITKISGYLYVIEMQHATRKQEPRVPSAV